MTKINKYVLYLKKKSSNLRFSRVRAQPQYFIFSLLKSSFTQFDYTEESSSYVPT